MTRCPLCRVPPRRLVPAGLGQHGAGPEQLQHRRGGDGGDHEPAGDRRKHGPVGRLRGLALAVLEADAVQPGLSVRDRPTRPCSLVPKAATRDPGACGDSVSSSVTPQQRVTIVGTTARLSPSAAKETSDLY